LTKPTDTDSTEAVAGHSDELIGVGTYTPAEAARLLRVPAPKIVRWLRGHVVKGKSYQPLWRPEISLGDGRTFLGFRDLMEVRVADAFISQGLPPVRVRTAIALAREVIGQDYPLSTNQFGTDGREIFLKVVEEDTGGQERERLLNLFRRQYEFKEIISPILRTVEFDTSGVPRRWWPVGRGAGVVVDPARSFGQPIDSASGVPTAVLAAGAAHDGIPGAARAYDVPAASVRQAVEFEADLGRRDMA
jgi:hypothetical protein